MLLPLTARGQILGFLGLSRARNPLPFSEDDLALAAELASRAAVCIDNARSHQTVRNASEILQRSLLPDHPPHLPGLEVACRYRPAQAAYEVGGVPFVTTTFPVGSGDRLVLYTNGLVEVRHHPIDERLDTLLRLLDAPDRTLEETCDRLLHELRLPADPDDVAVLIARMQPLAETGDLTGD